MKLPIAVLAAAFAVGLPVVARTLPAQAPDRVRADASALLPPDLNVNEFVVTADGKRTYLVTAVGELLLYRPDDKATTRLVAGPVWDLDVSPARNAVAYTKAGAERGDQHVWVQPLDPATGVVRGAERQLGTSSSDGPSISPDGKSVAFGRDDPSGVGQTLVVVPLDGGGERVVAPRGASSLSTIRWTPDGKTLYFGVNSPVACQPGWSCLPLAPDLRDPVGAIARVPTKGGTVVTVAPARATRPGLSPDGRTLLYLGTVARTTRDWVVANADGTARDSLTLPTAETPVTWLRGSVVLLLTVNPGNRARGEAPKWSLASMDLAASHSQSR
jgi:Tol biopolymer transport system component